jgi:hypothetical protein
MKTWNTIEAISSLTIEERRVGTRRTCSTNRSFSAASFASPKELAKAERPTSLYDGADRPQVFGHSSSMNLVRGWRKTDILRSSGERPMPAWARHSSSSTLSRGSLARFPVATLLM